ncbi:helix-turn-helix domain-containing protein [Akkermansia glycaniphila]|uniref:helix-turn-helix domain-containing protein n=1 Tax=Akkermansia glycaniphila TaxID=1679444 RepID=UPI00081E9E34|nr:helix-turn-helix transcriptional regulator [Akkermansia glycaniphila]OCA04213.1 hypothetical protein AC781_00525 [Akkermansia glycaniphila]
MPNDIFISRLQVMSIRLKLTQKTLGELCNVNQATISSYLSGRRSPGADELARLSAALGVSMDWLWGVSEKMGESDISQMENNKLQRKMEALKKRLISDLAFIDES